MFKYSCKKMLIFAVLSLFISGCAGKGKELPRILWPPPPEQPRIEYIGTYSSEVDFTKTRWEKTAANIVGSGAEYAFKTPFGIASDGKGKVYVSDIHHHNIRIFDFNAKTVEFLSKNPIFGTPLGLEVDSVGNLYVADGQKQVVMVFAADKRPLFSFSDPQIVAKPAYLALNRKLGRIYISDGMGHRIVVFDMQGHHLFSFGKQGSSDGELYSPQGLAIDGQGRVFVADMFNSRIQVFDTEGAFLYKFGERGDQVWQFESPKDLAFDSDGNLYVVDNRKASILTYSPDGKLLLVTGAGRATGNKLGFGTPASIFIDQNDRIYVADSINKRFAVWQYLSEAYLKDHPITEQDIEKIQDFIEKGASTEKTKD
jgi:DNA-binding beta-propeller fold protein YncE